MILKIKAFIYRLTGIYLAEKEENEYITSDEFWDIMDSTEDPELDNRTVQKILIGSWQCKHGFYRSSR